MRKFYLQNAAGERFGLNKEQGVFFSDPSGLGFEQAVTWGDLGRGFFAILDDPDERSDPQLPITGKLTFLPPAYENYRSLVDWIHAAGQLQLIYQPYGSTEYHRPVTVGHIQKTELTKTRWLPCPVSFDPMGPWSEAVPAEIDMDEQVEDEAKGYFEEGDEESEPLLTEDGEPLLTEAGEILMTEGGGGAGYGYRYTEELRYGGDAAVSMSARISAAGHIPGAICLRYRGGITAPRIRLTGASSGTVYGICALSSVLGASEELELSTRYEDSHVIKRLPDGSEVDLLADIDLSQDPYFHIPTDEDSVLSIESAATFAGTASLLVYRYYRTV